MHSCKLFFLYINSNFFLVFTRMVAFPFTLPVKYFLKCVFTSLSSKPLYRERKTTMACLEINDITLSFDLSSYVTWSVILLTLEWWSALFRQWNKSTGIFLWISHWYGFLMLGLPVSRKYIFCNHNLLSVLKREPQFKLVFNRILRGSVGGLKAWKEPLICCRTLSLKIQRLCPKSSLSKTSKHNAIWASRFSSISVVLGGPDDSWSCSDSLSLSLKSTSSRKSSTDAMLNILCARLWMLL